MLRTSTLIVLALALPATAAAQGTRDMPRRLEVHLVPTAHAQIAIWIESAEGTSPRIFRTLGLTESVARRGIGNRPGALQMNSGFRWPYGRREGVLPIWAHRRYEATGVAFRRVVFAGRVSEGHASNAASMHQEVVNTRDEYFCLGFPKGGTDVDLSLDAITCASLQAFSSNKGRYLTEGLVAAGNESAFEPWEDEDGSGRMRPLSLHSLYPPRRDLPPVCSRCADHPDSRDYAAHAREVMPDIDSVSMATPVRDQMWMDDLVVPTDWPDGDYILYVEVNTERDYAPRWGPDRFPTPDQPSAQWDFWSKSSGFAYRGQPSVLFAVPIRIDQAGGVYTAGEPIGYGELHGLDGEVHPMDGTIMDDPDASSGSGADRLRVQRTAVDGAWRVRVVVPTVNVCAQIPPPPECMRPCGEADPCAEGFLCGPDGVCVGACDLDVRPERPGEVELIQYPDRRHSHEYALLRFVAPPSVRGLHHYEVRMSTEPLTDPAAFSSWGAPAKEALPYSPGLTIATAELDGSPLPAGMPGSEVEVEIGGLVPETPYYLAMRVADSCGAYSELAHAELTTTSVRFTTVSPCFVATTAHGDPLDARIGVLRRLRDRHLQNDPIGRAAVSLYETIGPVLARWIAADEGRRAMARAALAPWVALGELANGSSP